MSNPSDVPKTQTAPQPASSSLVDELPVEMRDTIDRDLGEGDKVGEYEVSGKLGEGGFGTVYKAVQPLIGKKVAIKVLKRQFSANPSTLSRFIQEARAVNQIQHRYIIDIFSFGQLDDGRHYYVMSYLDGQTLQDVINRTRRLDLDVAIPILRAIAEAIDAAHQSGIAHRDLKPENVFITKDGSVKLLDFGIAKLMGTQTEHKTETGAMMGTPVYMSPEQCRSADKADHRTDIYSLGVMTFQMVTGQLPFNAASAMDIIIKHLTSTPPNPSAVYNGLPTSVDAPLLQMLEKEPEARPSSMTAAIDAVAAGARAAGIEIPHTLSGLPQIMASSKSSSMELLPTLGTGEEAPGAHFGQNAHAAPSTIMGAESQSRPPRGKSRLGWVVTAAGGLAIGAAVIAFTMLGGEQKTDQANQPADQTAAATAGAVESPVTPEPASPVAPEPAAAVNADEAEPAAPDTVTIDVQGAPRGTRVLGPDGEELGTAPGIIELARGDTPLTLTFERSGYKNKTKTLTPSANAFLEIEMDRARKTRTRKSSRSGSEATASSQTETTTDKPRKKVNSADTIEDPGL